MTVAIAEPGGTIRGKFTVPGDKSMSHRAVMFASLAEGTSRITGWLAGEDSLNTLSAFASMGADISQNDTSVVVKGVGMRGLNAPADDLYMGNAGTGMRLIAGLLAAQTFATRLTGDESLSRRPMGRIIKPLSLMGANVSGDSKGCPPLSIEPAAALRAIDYQLPMASAQVKSSILLAALYANGVTRVTEPATTRDHTERMLQTFGYPVSLPDSNGTVELEGGGKLTACDIEIPADISSAAFPIVAACITPSAEITLTNVGVNPTRTGVIDILRLMGADIELVNQRLCGAEPVADIQVRYAPLRGVDIPPALVPLAIDELPVTFIAASVADGVTRVTGAEELRVKESDRIASMAVGLQTLGVAAEPTPDGMVITGGEIGGGTVDTFFDHRIAMSFCVASLRANAPIVVNDVQHVETSFPGFFELCRSQGMNLRTE
jgi:3-phosphoshikimate 1-carboxyvinyltransferase